MVQERHDAFALGKQSVFMWLEIGVPARGKLSPSSMAVGQVVNPNHSGSSSEEAQGLSCFDVGLAFCPLLVASLEWPARQQRD